MNEVCPLKYSAADRPSKCRAAPAKNLIWSSIGPISSCRVTAIGLPVFSDSIFINSSDLASIASAILLIAFCLSPGVDSRQVSNAFAAAFMALSISFALETGAFAKT